ncbi:MAG: hypothetical protein H8E73_05100 [Planctomycetes bacterium]|nr:hypothetical protein [Planctomycetota bacterium]
MSTWIVILVPLGTLLVGFMRQQSILRNKMSRINLATEFLNNFLEWCNSRGQDHSLYNWLLSKSETVQTMLGTRGLIHLRKPFESGYHRNCPIILNAIPEIEREWCNEWRVGRTIQIYGQMVDGCLRRFIGSTEEQLRCERIRLFNPVVLFCGGVAWLMELPLFILSETKIITTTRRALIANGRVFSLLSGLTSLAVLTATIMTIVMGWEKFNAIVTGWIK